MPLFLDANAHLPLHPKAIEAYINFNKSLAGYGHAQSSNTLGRAAATELENARSKIASLIGAKPNQIVFTSTCTQACEWGLEILANQNFDKVYISTIEHKAVASKARNLFGNNDLFVNKEGIVSCAFTPPEHNSAFVCIHVQNEIGSIQPIQDIRVPFFCDMSQSLGKIPLDVSKYKNLKVAAFGCHKFGGPNMGFLYLQDPKWWKEFGSGGRYHFDRPGTPDVGQAIAASIALEEAIKTLPQRYQRALVFRDIIENSLVKMGVEIIGSTNRIPHTTFFNVGKKMAPFIMSQLENDGIYVGLGSACGALVNATNPVMIALGYRGTADDYIRISQFGEYGEREAKAVALALWKHCSKIERV